MASANDIRDILSLPREPSTSTAVPRKSGGPGTGLRKPEGISRELYSLLGDNVPTLVAQFARPKFKQKPVFGKGKSTWYFGFQDVWI
jgi:DNA methyltransferase 1-associated protein 1